MIKICDIVSKSHNDVEIKYDFCELNGFDYENNIIFSAYIENDSEAASTGSKIIIVATNWVFHALIWLYIEKIRF